MLQSRSLMSTSIATESSTKKDYKFVKKQCLYCQVLLTTEVVLKEKKDGHKNVTSTTKFLI